MSARKIRLSITVTLILLSSSILSGKAASGLPNSPEFGYGARISASGQQMIQSLGFAPDLGLNWIAVNFDWSRLWQNPEAEPKLSTLLELLDQARQKDLSVLLSISNPPAWAMTPNGPNPDRTASITLKLVSSFPDTILVVELFPGANTSLGWGANPNPDAYIGMIQKVRNTLSNQNLQAYVIPSFSPLPVNPASGDIDDLTFLKKFYEAEMATPIVGLRYQQINGQPFTEPSQTELNVLRHYEMVRNLMLQNNHQADLIWITSFSYPSRLASMEEQAAWVYEAYKLLKAQLYIGAAFFNSLNPASSDDIFYTSASLVLPDGRLHPAAAQLKKVSSGSGDSLTTSPSLPQTHKGILKKFTPKTFSKRPSS